MTNYRDEPPIPLEPFPMHRPDSPFPPLAESVAAPAPAEPDPPSDWIESADAHDLPTRENALAALGRFAFPPGPPLDDDGQSARDRRWASRSIVFAALFLLIFNAVSPQNWSRLQPPGWGTETVRRMSDVWAEQIALTGADRPRQWVHDVWRDWQEMRFSGSEPPPV